MVTKSSGRHLWSMSFSTTQSEGPTPLLAGRTRFGALNAMLKFSQRQARQMPWEGGQWRG